MTNFSAGRPPRAAAWMTPERAVVLIPIILGVVIASMLLIFGFTPLSVLVRDRQATVDQLKLKRDAVPGLRQELESLRADQETRESQKDQLLGLIAGTADLATFLAELNLLALAESVTITATEPGEIERYVPPPEPPEGESPNEDPPVEGMEVLPTDPLLNQGLEKRSAALTVQGPFEHVLSFLRALESLQVFVIINDLSVEAEPTPIVGNKAAEASPSASFTRMSLTLTAYGRTAALVQSGLDSALEEPEPMDEQP